MLDTPIISAIDASAYHDLISGSLDTFGNNFAIYRVPKGYIIYGEIEITMLDDSYHKKWIFSGKDIFVSLTREKSFEIKDNIIYVYDFEDRLYQLNFDGKEINRLG